MFWMSYIFILLIVFLHKHNCYYVLKNGDVQMMPSELNMVYNQIAQPLQRLAELLPGHNLEVQVDMLESHNAPIGTTRMNLKRIRKPPLNFKLREFDPEREELGHVVYSANKMVPSTTQPPTVQSLSQMGQAFNRISGIEDLERDVLLRLMRNKEEVKSVRSAVEGAIKSKQNKAIRSAASVQSAPPSGSAQDDKKPLFMEDLKKAFDEFEKKIMAKHKESKLLFDADPLSGGIEEAKKPLLKKDLWLAMGMKFMTGCPHLHQRQETSLSPGHFGTTRKINDYRRPNENEDMNPKIKRLVQLLKSGISGVQVARKVKPDENNMQWLQLKIPKRS